MKRSLLFLLVLCCADWVSVAAPITRSQARDIVSQLVTISDGESDDGEFSPYYIFSRGAGRGYVIASGDDATAPILGYTEQGDYDPEQVIEPLQAMLTAWAERIGQAQRVATPNAHRTARARAIASYKRNWTDVPALIKTHWHQSSPYNDMAPVQDNGSRCATGCVATAGSQVAYYFRKDNPTELQYDTPTYGYGVPVTVSLPKGTPIEWDKMRLSGSGTAAQNKAVATLMYALGTSAGLTYGASTSGHNYRSGHWNMADALKGQFRLNYSYKGKWDSSQQAWEELIYSNLKSGRPMLYSGVTDNNEGHSVVLDGYQASTGLYHFNFGWGGQGDGWYTVDDATGMNGFNSSQDLVYNFTPQVQNITAQLSTGKIYHKAPSTISYSLTNLGTLDFQGIYLFTGTTPKVTGQPAATDNTTVFPVDATTEGTLTVTTTTKNSVYIFLCDKSKRILDSCQVEVVPTVADLHLKRLSTDAGTAKTTVDGMDFMTINNTTATVTARLTNSDGGTYCQPAFQCYIEKYNQDDQSWTRLKSVIINDLTFETEQTRDARFSFTDLTPGTLYRAYLNHPAVASQQSTISFDTPDSIAYFTVREADLAVVNDGRTAIVSGRWNEPLFRQMATDPYVCSYDITELTELSVQPVAANPNALFYAAPEQKEWSAFDNVVADGECRSLRIQTGADFLPSHPFVAKHATFTMTDALSGAWHWVVVPFAAYIPYGMQAKAPEEWNDNLLNHSHTLAVDAMTPIIYLTGHDDLNTIEADEVTISAESKHTLFDGQLVTTTVTTPIEPTWLMVRNYLGSVYYVTNAECTQAEAFQSYIVSTTGDRVRTTTESGPDSRYAKLSTSINNVYTAFNERGLLLPGDAYGELGEALKAAEDMLTYRSALDGNAIDDLRKRLDAALDAFLENQAQGILTPLKVRNDHQTEVYNLSGQRLTSPKRGLVIVRQGGRIRKMLIK